jgi:hypothetical protein
MKSTTKHLTLEDVKNGVERMFTPDVSFQADERGEFYYLTATSTTGDFWYRRVAGVRTPRGKMVSVAQLESLMHSAGKYGLCVEQVPPSK